MKSLVRIKLDLIKSITHLYEGLRAGINMNNTFLVFEVLKNSRKSFSLLKMIKQHMETN